MEFIDCQESRNSKLRSLKVWKRIIIVHGFCLFLLIYHALFLMITTGYLTDIPLFFRELFGEIVNEPGILLYYAIISLVLNAFAIPRLIALYRFIKASVLGERRIKHVLFYILAVVLQAVLLYFGAGTYLSKAKKPVIYLYPETRTEVNVKLEIDGNLTVTYPFYDKAKGWTVTAEPDGTLTDENGRKYSYLYWEGDINIKPDLSRGFCVRGEDTAKFLEDALRQLGLSDKEADDFITYWLPEMEKNKYNVITFQTSAYEDVASLNIAPIPDTVIRVNMLWYSSDRQISIRPQELTTLNPSERKGFTVVEWGGEEYKKGPLRIESWV